MNEKDSVANFLNEVSDSKPDIFEERNEQEPTETTVEDEKPLPFHKDPKVQRYVERQISKALEGRGPAEQQFRQETAPSDVKDVIGAFAQIIGNDTPEKVKALEALEKTLNGADERASQKAIERFQAQMQEQEQVRVAQDVAAVEELEAGFDEIEENLGVDLTSNTAQAQRLNLDFRQYLKKIAPKDANGEVSSFPDIPAAFEEFQERNKRAPATRAKELANRGMARSGDTTNAPQSGARDWKAAERYISSLKNSN